MSRADSYFYGMRFSTLLTRFVAVLSLSFATARAQDVSVKGDVILKDGEPYAQMKKTGGMGATFTISALDGTEVLTAVYDKVAQDYVLSFSSWEEVRMANTIGFGKVLAKDIVRADLFKAGALNPAGVRKFLTAHGGSAAPALPTVSSRAEDDRASSATEPQLVKRDRAGAVTVIGAKLQQDFKTIATWKVKPEAANGTVYHTYTFSLPDGTVVAEAVLEGVNAKSAKVTTMKDNRSTTLAVEGYNQTGTAQTIAAWLVGRYYL